MRAGEISQQPRRVRFEGIAAQVGDIGADGLADEWPGAVHGVGDIPFMQDIAEAGAGAQRFLERRHRQSPFAQAAVDIGNGDMHDTRAARFGRGPQCAARR